MLEDRYGVASPPAHRPESFAQRPRFLYTFNLMMPYGQGVHDVGLARAKGGAKSAVA